MKKRIGILILCLVLVTILTTACAKPADNAAPSDAPPDLTDNGENQGNPPIEKARFADIQANWAWAISNGYYEAPGNQLVATGYATPKNLEELTLASDGGSMYTLKYAGEKDATGNNGDYNPTFAGVAGPSWDVSEGTIPDGQYDLLLLPASCRSGILALTPAISDDNYQDGFDNHGYPAADPADVAVIEALKNGRKVMHSELLATTANGGRIALFQFENTDYGLLMLAYIEGGRIITKEFLAAVYDKKAMWRADAEDDNICLFEVKLLCETDAGMVIGFSWYGPEGVGQNLLLEREGKFTDFISEEWYYNIWEGNFEHSIYELRNEELWPDLDSAALVGTWEGNWGDSSGQAAEEDMFSYTFRPDGTGEYRSFNNIADITYYIEGNLIIYKQVNINIDLFYAKIEGNQLISDRTPVLTKKDALYFYKTTDNVNLRKLPGTESAIITTVPLDTTVSVIDLRDNEWFLVEFDGQTGYMKAEFLTDINDKPIPETSVDYITMTEINATLNAVKDKLESKGWHNLQVIEGEPDSRTLWGVILEPSIIEENTKLYTVMGQISGMYDNPITVVIKMVFNNNMPEGKRVDLFYVSDSGRTMDVDSKEFDEVLSANDTELWDYMYSY